ncbi:MAG TPA: hypothetical protein VJS64_09800 [Pyrinomonadaceae bacterium]|nr:hypothetical protein [Pyrinomonadaceae bacterium]
MKTLSWFLLVILLLTPAAHTLAAGQKANQFTTTDQIRMKIAKLGVGESAKATITTRDGLKTKGYVYSAGDEDFVMRDSKSLASTTIRYADVNKVETSKGFSAIGRAFTIAGITTAATLAGIYFAITANER